MQLHALGYVGPPFSSARRRIRVMKPLVRNLALLLLLGLAIGLARAEPPGLFRRGVIDPAKVFMR